MKKVVVCDNVWLQVGREAGYLTSVEMNLLVWQEGETEMIPALVHGNASKTGSVLCLGTKPFSTIRDMTTGNSVLKSLCRPASGVDSCLLIQRGLSLSAARTQSPLNQGWPTH